MRNDGRREFQMIGVNTVETNAIFQLAKSTSNMPTTKLIPERSITTKTFTFRNLKVDNFLVIARCPNHDLRLLESIFIHEFPTIYVIKLALSLSELFYHEEYEPYFLLRIYLFL